MKTLPRNRKRETGQAAVLVIVAMAVFLLGGVGLAIDGSHLYAERQMAQAAADAAAQAGIRSIFTGSYADGSSQAFSTNLSSTGYTCASSDAQTPCYYAQTLNGFNGGGDTVSFKEPTAASIGVIDCGTAGTPLYCGGGANLLQVSVSRQVPTTFFKLISSWTPKVTASATAAIVSVMSPVPIIVTHPWITSSFSTSGTGSTDKIKICGGPPLSIQVNSSDGSSLAANGQGTIDLAWAGPADPGNCTTGTGGSFGDFGGPSPSGLTLALGTTGQYIQPSYPILDPLSGVSPPSSTLANAHAPVALANGAYGCPASPAKPCELYFPGVYSPSNNGDIAVSNQTAVFAPGIYYMNGTNFTTHANGYMQMATGLTDNSTTVSVASGTVGAGGVTSCCGTNQGWDGTAPTSGGGMLVYMTGPSTTSVSPGHGHSTCTPPTGSADQIGQISIGANGSVSLNGSLATGSYKGVLFFVDRSAVSQSHSLDGGGGLILVGTVYMTDTVDQMGATSSTTCGQYQSLTMQGNAGSSTLIQGEIIASTLALGGTPGIVMNLNPNAVTPVRQIALVQ